MLFFFFFFSSRRRHTRSKRDWSSDVCSSDLELTLLVSIGLGGWLPVRLLQLLQQTWRLARHDDEGSFSFLIGCDCLPAIEASVGTSENVGDARRQSGENTLQVTRDLLPTRSVSIAQFAPDILAGFRQEGQNGLITLLALVLRIVGFAPAHLVAVERVHGGVG